MRRIKMVLAALVVMVAAFVALSGPAMADNWRNWDNNHWNNNNSCYYYNDCYNNNYYNNNYYPWWWYWLYPSGYGYNTWGW